MKPARILNAIFAVIAPPCGCLLAAANVFGEPSPFSVFLDAIPFGEGTPGADFGAVADFNKDGIPDLVLTVHAYDPNGNDTNRTVRVFLGKGDGTFLAPVGYEAGMGPQFIATGDFNGDGKTDLAVSNQGSYDLGTGAYAGNGLAVLLGKGDGSFSSAVRYEAGIEPQMITIGDFNGDGKLDLAVIDQGSRATRATDYGVMVLFGKGDGSFGAASHFSAGSHPQSLISADFNGDGKSDLAVAGLDGLWLLFGKTNFDFESHVADDVEPNATSVAMADFNRDGKLDLAVASLGLDGMNVDFTNSIVAVLLGNGDGTFQKAISTKTVPTFSPSGMAATDLDGDGQIDLIVSTPGGLSVLVGNGNGGFHAGGDYATSGNFVQVSDFNLDGNLDLVTGNGVIMGNGDGTFRAPFAWQMGTYGCGDLIVTSIATGDFNGDGQADLAIATQGHSSCLLPDGSFKETLGNLTVLLGAGHGMFQPPSIYEAGTQPVCVLSGDFNGDGKLDLAEIAPPDWNVSVLLGNGDGSFQSPLRTQLDIGQVDRGGYCRR